MFIQSLFKKSNYCLSKRDYLYDYSIYEEKKIDMTLSGKFLLDNRKINFDFKRIDEYPSHKTIRGLEQELKVYHNTNQEIILGAGANGILQNLVKIFFAKKGNLVTPFYTFNQVEFAVTSYGCKTRRVYTNNYKIDFKKMKKSINNSTRMVYICNPNNPTGLYEMAEDIIDFAKEIKVPVVVDESGIEFSKKRSLLSFPLLPTNIFVVRSFSKAYGLANLRLGYLVCSESFKEIYMKNITTNEVSELACNIATSLLKERKSINDNVNKVIIEKKKMIKELERMGIKCIDSSSNIIMTSTTFKIDFLNLLLKNDIAIVPIYDEINNIHIRIALQDEKTNEKFINTIKKIMEGVLK